MSDDASPSLDELYKKWVADNTQYGKKFHIVSFFNTLTEIALIYDENVAEKFINVYFY